MDFWPYFIIINTDGFTTSKVFEFLLSCFSQCNKQSGLPWGSQRRGLSLNVDIQTWFSCQPRTICNTDFLCVENPLFLNSFYRKWLGIKLLQPCTLIFWYKYVSTFRLQHLFSLDSYFKGLYFLTFTTCCSYLPIREPHFKQTTVLDLQACVCERRNQHWVLIFSYGFIFSVFAEADDTWCDNVKHSMHFDQVWMMYPRKQKVKYNSFVTCF